MQRTALAVILLALPLAQPSVAQTKPAAPASAPKKSVPFIEDDYKKAISEGRAKKLPVFIEAWAPW